MIDPTSPQNPAVPSFQTPVPTTTRNTINTSPNINQLSMQAHKSQKHDYERIMKMREGLPREEYFLVWERK